MVVQMPPGQLLQLAQMPVSQPTMVLDESIGECSVLGQVSRCHRLMLAECHATAAGRFAVLSQMLVRERAEFLQMPVGQLAMLAQVPLNHLLMFNQVSTSGLGNICSL